MTSFAVATNACPGDQDRLALVVPHWLRVFSKRLSEILIVIDEQPATGRIAALHGASGSLQALVDQVGRLERLDPRIRAVSLPVVDRVFADKWFDGELAVRCQAGTPIFAFAYAIEKSGGHFILRTDCDMLFHDGGWVNRACDLLSSGELDVVEPPRARPLQSPVSTRAFLISKPDFYARCLPLKYRHLDWLRRVHRMIQGRPTWLALEQTLAKEKRAGRIRHDVLPRSLGFSVHLAKRSDAALGWIQAVVDSVEAGVMCVEQDQCDDFDPRFWRHLEVEAGNV